MLMSAQTITSETTSTTTTTHITKVSGLGTDPGRCLCRAPRLHCACRHLHEYQGARHCLGALTLLRASILTCRVLLRSMRSNALGVALSSIAKCSRRSRNISQPNPKESILSSLLLKLTVVNNCHRSLFPFLKNERSYLKLSQHFLPLPPVSRAGKVVTLVCCFQTVKGGISETRIEKRIVITGDADIDHDQVSCARGCIPWQGTTRNSSWPYFAQSCPPSPAYSPVFQINFPAHNV